MTSQAVGAEKTARFILDRFVGLQSSDEALLISDPTADQEALATFRRALEEVASSCVTLSMPDTVETGDELPRSVDAALAAADVVVFVSKWFPAWVATRGFWRAIHEYGTR